MNGLLRLGKERVIRMDPIILKSHEADSEMAQTVKSLKCVDNARSVLSDMKTVTKYDPDRINNFDLIQGKAENVLKRFPDESINCTVTSPPTGASVNMTQKTASGLNPALRRILRI